MSGHGLPLWGDNRYNPAFQKGDAAMSGSAAERAAETGGQEQMEKKKPESGRILLRERRRSGTGRSGRALRVDVALAAYELAFTHPETGESMIFQHNPSGGIFRQFRCQGSNESMKTASIFCARINPERAGGLENAQRKYRSKAGESMGKPTEVLTITPFTYEKNVVYWYCFTK